MIFVWVEFVCRTCARTTSGRHVVKSTIPRRAMIRDAKAEGWCFEDEEAFCSQQCLDNYRSENST